MLPSEPRRAGPRVLLADCGTVLTWGRGEDGQLGHGDSNELTQPKAVHSLLGKGVTSVYCGAEFTVAVAPSGLFSWGWCVRLLPCSTCVRTISRAPGRDDGAAALLLGHGRAGATLGGWGTATRQTCLCPGPSPTFTTRRAGGRFTWRAATRTRWWSPRRASSTRLGATKTGSWAWATRTTCSRRSLSRRCRCAAALRGWRQSNLCRVRGGEACARPLCLTPRRLLRLRCAAAGAAGGARGGGRRAHHCRYQRRQSVGLGLGTVRQPGQRLAGGQVGGVVVWRNAVLARCRAHAPSAVGGVQLPKES